MRTYKCVYSVSVKVAAFFKGKWGWNSQKNHPCKQYTNLSRELKERLHRIIDNLQIFLQVSWFYCHIRTKSSRFNIPKPARVYDAHWICTYYINVCVIVTEKIVFNDVRNKNAIKITMGRWRVF